MANFFRHLLANSPGPILGLSHALGYYPDLPTGFNSSSAGAPAAQATPDYRTIWDTAGQATNIPTSQLPSSGNAAGTVPQNLQPTAPAPYPTLSPRPHASAVSSIQPTPLPTDHPLSYLGPTSDLGPSILATGQKYGLQPRLLAAIIGAESRGDPRAYRNEPGLGTASYGLGQTLGTTAQDLGLQGSPEQLYDPSTSVDYIGRYIQSKEKAYPDANFNDPYNVYNIYNTGHPGGNISPLAYINFFRQYQQAKQAFK